MATNPFLRFNPVDESNYLQVRIEALKDPSRPDSFNLAIEALAGVRKNLQAIDRLGRLQESGNRGYYLQAVQWLNRQSSISAYVAVQQISSIDEVDDNIASNFYQFATTLVSNFRVEPLYSQVEIASTVANMNTSTSIKDRESEILDELDSRARTIATDSTATLNGALASATESISQAAGMARGDVNDALTSARGAIADELNSSINQFRQARSLQDWGEAYDEDLRHYDQKLNGVRFAEGMIMRNMSSAFRIIKERKNKRSAALLLVQAVLKNLITAIKILWSKMFCYRGQRNIWFSLLIIFVLFFTFQATVTASGNSHSIAGFKLPVIGEIGEPEWYLKLTVYIPLVILLGLAYSFSVKNFRIYSNMVDQYRHRRTVATASQGIIRSLGDADDKDIRVALTTAAATALFQMKNTGHLTKKEAESLNMFDIFKAGGGSA